jgi:putative iron-regulated protein
MQAGQRILGRMQRMVCAGLTLILVSSPLAASAPAREVIANYADLALAGYEDSLAGAKALKSAIDRLVDKPMAGTLEDARQAWRAARVPYMQTEAFRFGNKVVDEWEGKVNAWPLDEGLIDYVDKSYGTSSDSNPLFTANVIANRRLVIAGQKMDASRITKQLLLKLQEAEKIEANVATGYHAIEFLLWGQDTNGTGPGAGRRPATDFNKSRCTGGNCQRRAEYLTVVADLLIEDLTWMVAQWKPDGAARRTLENSESDALTSIFTGLGSLSYGEMAGERMKLGLLLHDPEEEHDCFSDNTHNSHFYNVLGIENVYLGRYKRADGSVVSGASVSDLVKVKAPDVDERVRQGLSATLEKVGAIKARAETIEAYDQMIGDGNKEGSAVVEAAIAALVAQTRELERAIAVLDIKSVRIEGSDSLDDPAATLNKKK